MLSKNCVNLVSTREKHRKQKTFITGIDNISYPEIILIDDLILTLFVQLNTNTLRGHKF